MKVRVDVTYDLTDIERDALLEYGKNHFAFTDEDKPREILKAVFEELGGSAIQKAMEEQKK